MFRASKLFGTKYKFRIPVKGANGNIKTVRTVQRVLDSLREKELVERVESDKDGYWRVKE